MFYFTYLYIFSSIITPLALNKSRQLLNKDGFNSFLPTIRVQQFSDSFQGFTFLVEKKVKNEIKNVFIHDNSNVLKNLTSGEFKKKTTTIIAKEGIVDEKKMVLFNGQILSTEKDDFSSNVIKFEQLNIDLKNLQTDTIKVPKLQETGTYDLFRCITKSSSKEIINCKETAFNEIKTVLNRRIVLPFYIPIIALISSFLLIKLNSKRNYFLNKYTIFSFSFLILLYAELIIRFTGISKIVGIMFFSTPIFLIPTIYLILMVKLSRESLRGNAK